MTNERPLILIAEDDDELRRLIIRALIEESEVEAVSDGAALLARLVQPPLPSLIVTDLRMPWLDGLEAIRRACAGDAQRWVPTVLVTAFPDAGLVQRAAEAGVELLAKPFDLDVLRSIVRTVLASSSPWAEPEHDGYGPIRPR